MLNFAHVDLAVRIDVMAEAPIWTHHRIASTNQHATDMERTPRHATSVGRYSAGECGSNSQNNKAKIKPKA